MRAHHDFDRRRFLDPGRDPEHGYAAFLASQLLDTDAAILVADHDGDAVGYVHVGIEPRSWKELRDRAGFIHDIVVHPDHQRHGIASVLMSEAFGWLRGRGVPRVMLWTAVENAGAQALFTRYGFRKTMIEMTRELEAPRSPG